MMTLKRESAVQIVYVRSVSEGDAARRQFMTLYGYGASRMRKSNLGLFSMARTTRLIVVVDASQREIMSRRRVRDIMNTVIAPARAAV